ncbi:MAG TPA: MFS transporter, partial [Anaeromyxobacter sp.]|nr:MFS transporter [Anaeromyxobacter sp.]
LAVALGGLVLGTFAGAFATGLGSMLAARTLAGSFGGPATALALAIVADVVPPERRGRALGAVMGAFAAASVLGVPAGLELARLGGWRAPFVAVAALGVVLAAVVTAALPPMRGHLAVRPGVVPLRGAAAIFGADGLLRRPVVVLSLLATGVAMLAQFALVPNIAAYWQFNLGFPRERLGLLFVAGGLVSLVTMRLAGRLADRAGAAFTAGGGTAVFIAVLFAAFIFPVHAAAPLFVAFMAASTFRMVPMQALMSQVPRPQERARFMSVQSVVQHLASATGAFGATRLLTELPGGRLAGMDSVASISAALAAAIPALLWLVESRVRRRDGRDAAVRAPALRDAARG